MADAIIYSGLDEGGPGQRLGVTSSSINGVVGLYNLLVACLVTGYGVGGAAKTGQGWEIAHADLPTGFTLLAPDGVYYTFCRGPGQTYNYAPACQVYMSEGVSDLTTYPPGGSNVRSGDYILGSGETKRMWINAIPHYSYNQGGEWFLFARGSQVLFIYSGSGGFAAATGQGPSSESGGHNYGSMFYLGNVVLKGEGKPKSGPQNSCVLAGYPNQSSSYTDNNWNPSSEVLATSLGGGCMSLRNFVTGAVEAGRISRFYGRCNMLSGKNASKTDFPVYPPDLSLTRVPFWEGGMLGYMPGQFYDVYYSHMRADYVLNIFGRATSSSEFLMPLEVGGEPFYMVPTAFGCLFISTLEKYWDA